MSSQGYFHSIGTEGLDSKGITLWILELIIWKGNLLLWATETPILSFSALLFFLSRSFARNFSHSTTSWACYNQIATSLALVNL